MRIWTYGMGLVVAASAVARAQDPVAIFTGTPGSPGAITVHDALTGNTLAAQPEWSGLTLLAIDYSARTDLQEFLTTRPRRYVEPGGSSRLRLPEDRGSLYHFERPLAGGASNFGYLLVPAAALPRILLELPGTGPTGTVDPFLDRVGVAPDGSAFLVGTTVDAGGDLFELSTLPVTNPVAARSANLTPLPLISGSLLLGRTYGLAVTTRGVVRFDRSNLLDGRKVPFLLGERPALYTGEIVQSPNTDFACFTAGSSASSLDVFTVGASGPARRATDAPAAISGAGSAPQAVDGPWLAVSDDGQWAAWRLEVPPTGTTNGSDECCVNRVASPTLAPAEQLSSNARFTDTLDEVALFAFNGPNRLTFAVGERGAAGGPIEKIDVFSATLAPAQTPAIANLSLSSGDATEPFLAIPTLNPTRTALLPDGSATLIHSDEGSLGTLYLVSEGTGGAQVVRNNVRNLLTLDFAGPHALLSVRASGNTRELLRLSPAVSPLATLIATGGSAFSLDLTVPRRDGWMAYVLQNGGQSLLRTNLATGFTPSGTGIPGPIEAIVGWSATGRTLFTSNGGGNWVHSAWALNGTLTTVATTATESRILPAN